jgi:hypothetical protein
LFFRLLLLICFLLVLFIRLHAAACSINEASSLQINTPNQHEAKEQQICSSQAAEKTNDEHYVPTCFSAFNLSTKKTRCRGP